MQRRRTSLISLSSQHKDKLESIRNHIRPYLDLFKQDANGSLVRFFADLTKKKMQQTLSVLQEMRTFVAFGESTILSYTKFIKKERAYYEQILEQYEVCRLMTIEADLEQSKLPWVFLLDHNDCCWFQLQLDIKEYPSLRTRHTDYYKIMRKKNDLLDDNHYAYIASIDHLVSILESNCQEELERVICS